MKRVEEKLSPEAFSLLRETLLRAELKGYGPTEAAAIAMAAVGLGVSWPPREPTETVLIVDYSLHGTAYPFNAPVEPDQVRLDDDST